MGTVCKICARKQKMNLTNKLLKTIKKLKLLIQQQFELTDIWFYKASENRLIPVIGVEPILPSGNRILNPARLPIPPHRHISMPDYLSITKGGNRI